MKKLLLLFTLLIADGAFVCAHASSDIEQVDLQVGIYDPTQPVEETHRSPMQPPHLYQDGSILNMQYVPFDATLQILDDNGDVVFTAWVPAFTTTVVLPNSLSGSYEIRLIEGYWYFYGWINL